MHLRFEYDWNVILNFFPVPIISLIKNLLHTKQTIGFCVHVRVCVRVCVRVRVCVCVSYSGLAGVVLIQQVQGDLLGQAPQQAGGVQVPLEAEQTVDPPLRRRVGRARQGAQTRCRHKGETLSPSSPDQPFIWWSMQVSGAPVRSNLI